MTSELHNIVRVCPGCNGTGKHTGIIDGEQGPVEYDVQCEKCDGTGRMQVHLHLADELISFLQDLSDAVDDVLDKVDDVLDKVNDIKETVDQL